MFTFTQPFIPSVCFSYIWIKGAGTVSKTDLIENPFHDSCTKPLRHFLTVSNAEESMCHTITIKIISPDIKIVGIPFAIIISEREDFLYIGAQNVTANTPTMLYANVNKSHYNALDFDVKIELLIGKVGFDDFPPVFIVKWFVVFADFGLPFLAGFFIKE